MTNVCFIFILVAETGSHKGVPIVYAASGVLARTKLPYQSLVQDGEANVTRIGGKHKALFLTIGVTSS